VTSSQPVVTPTALNFTPDNKHCYAYSGDITGTGAGSASVTALTLTTNTEYIKSKIQVTHSLPSGHDFYVLITFNGDTIVSIKEDATEVEYWPLTLDLIIPPFTDVIMKFGSNTTGYTAQFNLTGKAYGMTETGFQ